MTSPILGRRAVYKRTHRRYDEAKKKMVDTAPAELFHGTIVWIGTRGDSGTPSVIMLYDAGVLIAHSIEDVTVEGEQTEGGPFR